MRVEIVVTDDGGLRDTIALDSTGAEKNGTALLVIREGMSNIVASAMLDRAAMRMLVSTIRGFLGE